MSTQPLALLILRDTIDTVVEIPQAAVPRIDARAAVRRAANAVASQAHPFALGLGLALTGRTIAIPITMGYPVLSHFLSDEDWDGRKPTVRQFTKFYATYVLGAACAYAPDLLSAAQRLME